MNKFFKSLINLITYSGSVLKKHGLMSTITKVFSFIQTRGVFAFWNTARVSSSNTALSLGSTYKSSRVDYFDEILNSSSRSLYFTEYENRMCNVPNYEDKIICFYLPQFHPFNENNKFWGEGFTEWSNVTKAFPLFKGHAQPRYPKDLGYYDLRLKDTIKKQSEIAKNYGVYGFCFHYYWFNGLKVMDTPINILFENKDINIKYCLNWANENWTRRWDGLENDVLLKQLYTEEDYYKFIKDVSLFFSDERYIKFENRPVLIIYRSELITDVNCAVKIWRDYTKELGFPDLHLIMTESFEDKKNNFPFDAVVDFAPNNFKPTDITSKQEYFHPNFQGHVFSYASLIDYSIKKKKDFPYYRSVCLEWDNTARKGSKGNVFHGCNRDLFESWLSQLFKLKPLNRTIFVNAWNEWAEGTYLEPDRKNGFAYLQAIYEQLNKNDAERKEFIRSSNNNFVNTNKKALVFHIHYFDIFEEFIRNYLSKASEFDLICTITPNINLNQIKIIKNIFPKTLFMEVENIGRDVLPFLTILKQGLLDKYDVCLKLHTKKSIHLSSGNQWRQELYSDLMETKLFERAFQMSDEKCVIWTKTRHLQKIEEKTSINYKRLLSLLGNMSNNSSYVKGTMFWFEPKKLKALIPESLLSCDFEKEPIPNDGSWAHVIERYIGAKVQSSGFKIITVDSYEE